MSLSNGWHDKIFIHHTRNCLGSTQKQLLKKNQLKKIYLTRYIYRNLQKAQTYTDTTNHDRSSSPSRVLSLPQRF